MANRDCNGDIFSVDGEKFYRCFWDGTVTTKTSGTCSHCEREIAYAADRGEVPVVVKRVAMVGDLEVTIPDAPQQATQRGKAKQ